MIAPHQETRSWNQAPDKNVNNKIRQNAKKQTRNNKKMEYPKMGPEMSHITIRVSVTGSGYFPVASIIWYGPWPFVLVPKAACLSIRADSRDKVVLLILIDIYSIFEDSLLAEGWFPPNMQKSQSPNSHQNTFSTNILTL